MSVLRTIRCDVCGAHMTEQMPNAGWPRWGQVTGIETDGETLKAHGQGQIHLCPDHLGKVRDLLQEMM